MAKKFVDFDDLMKNWTVVTEKDNPIEFRAWIAWRKYSLGCAYNFERNSLTVPSLYPPTTQAAANDYVSIVRQLRQANGWNEPRAKLTDNPTPWSGS